MMPSQQGYDRAITVFSPDGRLYQVEYAIETVRRGALAVGIKTKEGVVIAVEENHENYKLLIRHRKYFRSIIILELQPQGIFQMHVSQIDNARTFSQSNKLVYDEAVEVETVAKHLADQCQQYTQYGGARPIGVSLIIGGIDPAGTNLYMTDPSGAYISYDAISIGANSDIVNEFLEKNYKEDMSLDDAASLAIASIYISSETKEGIEHIKMSKVSEILQEYLNLLQMRR